MVGYGGGVDQRTQVELELLAAKTSAGAVDVTALQAAVTALESQVSTLQLQVAELQGYHGSGFTTGFSSGFRIGPQQ